MRLTRCSSALLLSLAVLSVPLAGQQQPTVDGVYRVLTQRVAPLTADAPMPPDGQADVPVGTTTLTWTPLVDVAATEADLYIGTVSPPPKVATVTESSFTVGLAFNQTYYWQVVTRNAAGETVGPIWSFRTPMPVPLTLTVPTVEPITALDPTGAVVTYPPPEVTGGAAPVTVECAPASGTFFPLGATSVTCTATDAGQQTASGQFTVTVLAPPVEGPHEYFDRIKALPTHYFSFSMRDNAQIRKWVQGSGWPTQDKNNRDFSYLPEQDTHDAKQDAMKLWLKPGILNAQQLRVPFTYGSQQQGILWIIWDAYWDKSFRTNRGSIAVNKTFMTSSNCSSAQTVSTEQNVTYYSAAPQNIGIWSGRFYTGCGFGGETSMSGRLWYHELVPNTWYRIVEKYDFTNSLTTNRATYSQWLISEQFDARPIYQDYRFTVYGGGTRYAIMGKWMEFNTSSSCGGCGDRVAYMRNLLVLRDPTEEQIALLWQRPKP